MLDSKKMPWRSEYQEGELKDGIAFCTKINLLFSHIIILVGITPSIEHKTAFAYRFTWRVWVLTISESCICCII